MKPISFRLSSSQKRRLDQDFPYSPKNAVIGNRAVGIVKLYFLKAHPDCSFGALKKGTDLHPIWTGGEAYLEIKGTDSEEMAWNKLKVSGKNSFNLLTNGMPIYRVTSVFSDRPTIHILKYGTDFNMTGEDRWSVQALKPNYVPSRSKVSPKKQRA
jgi:choline dehydrogenase-like flavoprotein